MKSERHHRWPEAVSQYWTNAEGGIQWLRPDGSVEPLRPNSIGVIGNAHAVKLSRDPAQATVWDTSFEHEFQSADAYFPSVIDWLVSLEKRDLRAAGENRFLTVPDSNEKIGQLVEGLVSLAVRSPMTREAAVAWAEELRGPLPERERNTLIGLNMRNLQRTFTESIGTSGKFVVIHSPDREFDFGDGFFHNMTSMMPPHAPKMLVPLTPRISVLYARPMSYITKPTLMTLLVGAQEADLMNATVQVHARKALFYRHDRPVISEHFQCAKHLRFASSDNPVDRLIETIPGERGGQKI